MVRNAVLHKEVKKTDWKPKRSGQQNIWGISNQIEQWPHIYGALSGSNAISRRKVGLLKRDCRSSLSGQVDWTVERGNAVWPRMSHRDLRLRVIGWIGGIWQENLVWAPQETECADVSGFCHPATLTSGCTFVPPTTTCCLPQLPAAFQDYLLPVIATVGNIPYWPNRSIVVAGTPWDD
jgi:hypothetical protein